MADTSFTTYYTGYRAFRQQLFDLFTAEGAVLETKDIPSSLGTTWGYWLSEWDGRHPEMQRSAASIGEDEIKLFYDLCQLIQPARSYIIGNSFGLSTFCLALAWPAGFVVAIDTWGDADTLNMAKPLFERIMAHHDMANVRVHTGASPQDTPAALTLFPTTAKPLSLYFIDGLHRNPAALHDFEGALPFLDSSSVVLWHNVNAVSESFRMAYEQGGRALFDQHHVLRTHGPLGIDYSSTAHPLLHAYLHDATLIWNNWEYYMALLEREDMRRWQGDASLATLPRRVAAAAYRRLTHARPGDGAPQ
ncbi:MAG TPA: class I SAM-dependent methyltransferase [Gemmatimonadaceae bacterium]|jgi:predicted O-methyltransferase YrrM|nr:class I SAM-dependent methyltransferase [Gemmatimonadaceae bacterium]